MTKSSLALLLALAALVVSTGGCAFSVPDITTVPEHPTFEVDVKPLLADHCGLCHGYPADRGAPNQFRVDTYADKDGVQGVASVAEELVSVTDEGEMPPSAAWGDGVGPNGRELLRRWLADGSPP
ncbi:MAG: hypothetical protein ACOYOB_15885 [Myxococcota bacterium]